MDQQIKTQVIKFFKIGGFQLRSDVAMILVEKIRDFDVDERKKFIDKIFSNIQNQTLETNNIENEQMIAAIRVSKQQAPFFHIVQCLNI